ncbi:glucose-1-phosphate thymidylyltransferase [Ruminococcaceae bacterium YRB3002]|nr:glucose-1-phosphate thymidylyltransferase [Ruminococcaceae bacterium YRB3002]
MKGIILAAGKGTRLHPITLPVCKPLLPVYDKPLIYYSLATLMNAGIRDILIIIPPDEQKVFENLLGDGSKYGINISYLEQKVQRGIADAFIIGKEFIGDDSVCLALGDNIFYGPSFRQKLRGAVKELTSGATIFGYYVNDPRPFGVVEFDTEGTAISIEEKPKIPKSNYIVPGLYFYDNDVVRIAADVKPSARGELEITSVNNEYLKQGKLHVIPLGQEFSWFDAGTADSLYTSAGAIRSAQRSGKMIACLEEIAVHNRWITIDELEAAAEAMKQTQYGQYMLGVVNDLRDEV